MPDSSAHTTQLHDWLQRMRAGYRGVRDEMLCRVGAQLERLARKMLRRYPRVQRWADTDDVLQNALLRLLRALEQVQPGSMGEFFGLAAEQMRRELLDLAKHFHDPLGEGANHASHVQEKNSSVAPAEPPDAADNANDLERWCAFHEGVAALPAEEREVVGLVFYHDWTQVQVAELFGVTERTVQRRWRSALEKLHQVVNDNAPKA